MVPTLLKSFFLWLKTRVFRYLLKNYLRSEFKNRDVFFFFFLPLWKKRSDGTDHGTRRRHE